VRHLRGETVLSVTPKQELLVQVRLPRSARTSTAVTGTEAAA
jgi:hypothetical protein